MMKKVITLALVLFATVSFAQKERTLKLNKETNLIDVVYYHDNGEISQVGTYTIDGKLQGEWISYNKEGEKVVLANYENGKKVGKWFYYNNGTVKEVDYTANVIARMQESEVKSKTVF